MLLQRYKIEMFKSIQDSGWIDVHPLTVIVGKNEAGKTTALKALHKLKPFVADQYNIDREWPRGRRTERKPKATVCTAEFKLTDDEKKYITDNLFPTAEYNSGNVLVSNGYANILAVDYTSLFKQEPTLEVKAVLEPYLLTSVPTFIYMDDYRVFSGSAHLEQLVQRVQINQATEADKTLMTILNLSGLDLNTEVAQGNSPEREQRQYDLDDASLTLTNMISDRWKQKRYEVSFRADGQLFYTFVKDEAGSLIKLEERSKGFQWFFSFDLMFMYESKGSFKNCVILLDEPGLHLHPDGQTDLLKRLENYSNDNVLIYTTHLPFMIDLQKPEGIRIVTDNTNGSFITDKLISGQPESKFVLQAALGMNGSQSYLISQKNLVVEGVIDYWLLSEISSLLIRSGLEGFDSDIFITPAGGAAEAVYITTFMIGQKLKVFTLLDLDPEGEEAKKKLITKWLTKYQDTVSKVETLSEATGATQSEFAIEDIFPDDFYLNAVKETYAVHLATAGLTNLTLVGSGMLCKRVEHALKGSSVPFNKGSVAKVIRKKIALMKDAKELPGDAVKYVSAIVAKVNSVIK